jgi:DNA polymerase III delta subunit
MTPASETSLVLIVGDDAYLRGRALKRHKAHWEGALGVKTLQNPTPQTLLEAVQAPSLFGPSLTVVEGFAWLNRAAAEDDAALLALLIDTLPGKPVVFVSEKADGKLKFAKWLKTHAKVEAYDLPASWRTQDAVDRLMAEARERGLKITPDAAHKLVEAVGVDTLTLVTELEKVSFYQPGQPITAAIVELLCGQSDNRFAMLEEWVYQRDRAKVFAILGEVLLREHPLPVFAQAQNYVNYLFWLRTWHRARWPESQLAQALKKSPQKIGFDLKASAKVPEGRLAMLKRKAVELEQALKTGQLPADLALELLLAS